jgi:hypothetical protein
LRNDQARKKLEDAPPLLPSIFDDSVTTDLLKNISSIRYSKMLHEITELEIRSALLNRLKKSNGKDLIVEELGLCRGESRIDIACIGNRLTGFEIKSDFDSLKRLPGQITFYNSIFDKMYLVTTQRHFQKAQSVVPENWGIYLVKKRQDKLQLVQSRKCRQNEDIKGEMLIQLLWKDEVIDLVKAQPSKKSYRSMTKDEIYAVIINSFSLRFIQKAVSKVLRDRNNWKPVRKPG